MNTIVASTAVVPSVPINPAPFMWRPYVVEGFTTKLNVSVSLSSLQEQSFSIDFKKCSSKTPHNGHKVNAFVIYEFYCASSIGHGKTFRTA